MAWSSSGSSTRNTSSATPARAGDTLVPGKPLGVGIYSAALRKERLAPEHYRALIDSATRLNAPGVALGRMAGVHALADVTGFGLLGHLLEICRASNTGARVDFARVPAHPGALQLARDGFVTGASSRNWTGYGGAVDRAAVDDAELALLTDPQTSGGLLVACAPEAVSEVLQVFAAEGFAHAAVIGEILRDPQQRVTVGRGVAS
jgi:selenide,water dikinase